MFKLDLEMASLVAQKVKSLPAVWETQVQPLVWEDSPGEGNGNPLQYSMDRGALWVAVHRVAKSQTQLSNFTFTFTYRKHYDSNIRKLYYRKCVNFLRCHSKVSQTGDLKKKNAFPYSSGD